MKKTINSLLMIFFASTVTGQGLLSNWSFENNMQLNCQGWYDGCGNELTISCDTFSYCQVRFRNVSPSMIPEEMWSLELVAGMIEGFAETYITGQIGTNIYKLTYMMKSPGWLGSVSIGTLYQNQFIASKTLTDTSSIWKSFEFTDTLTTQATDTIVIRLSAGLGDFCICTSYFDLVALNIINPPTSLDGTNRFTKDPLNIYPNPTSEFVTVTDLNGEHTKKLSIFNILGTKMQDIQIRNHQIDLSHLPDGVYFLQLESKEGIVTRKVVKRAD